MTAASRLPLPPSTSTSRGDICGTETPIEILVLAPDSISSSHKQEIVFERIDQERDRNLNNNGNTQNDDKSIENAAGGNGTDKQHENKNNKKNGKNDVNNNN